MFDTEGFHIHTHIPDKIHLSAYWESAPFKHFLKKVDFFTPEIPRRRRTEIPSTEAAVTRPIKGPVSRRDSEHHHQSPTLGFLLGREQKDH